MSREIRVTWSQYRTCARRNVAHVPEVPGVYRLARLDEEGRISVLLVGQADNLRVRLAEHLSTGRARRELPVVPNEDGWLFTFAKVSSRSDRDGIERFLTFFYNPSCGDPAGVPDGPDVVANTC